jgi:signal transduction histidine kinase
LLEFERVEAGSLKYSFAKLEAGELIRRTVDEFEPNIDLRGFQLKLMVKSFPLFILVDKLAIKSAFWNLVDNAMKYSPNGDTVWVEVDHKEDYVAIRVTAMA